LSRYREWGAFPDKVEKDEATKEDQMQIRKWLDVRQRTSSCENDSGPTLWACHSLSVPRACAPSCSGSEGRATAAAHGFQTAEGTSLRTSMRLSVGVVQNHTETSMSPWSRTRASLSARRVDILVHHPRPMATHHRAIHPQKTSQEVRWGHTHSWRRQ